MDERFGDTYDLWVAVPSPATHVGCDTCFSQIPGHERGKRTEQWEIGVVGVHLFDERRIFRDRMDAIEDGLRLFPELCERVCSGLHGCAVETHDRA